MTDSPFALQVHLVWSTNYRDQFLRPGHHAMLWATFAATCKAHGATHLVNGGVADHVHLMVELGPKAAIATIVRDLKLASAERLRGPLGLPSFFQWQAGYAAFSVADGALEDVKRQIATQELQHRAETYEEELRRLFAGGGIGGDVGFFENRDGAIAFGR